MDSEVRRAPPAPPEVRAGHGARAAAPRGEMRAKPSWRRQHHRTQRQVKPQVGVGALEAVPSRRPRGGRGETT